MSDDKTNPGPEDGKLISLTEDYEVRYWCRILGVTAEELRQLVDKFGHSAAAVRAGLAGEGCPAPPE